MGARVCFSLPGLASLLGLGGIGEKVRAIFETVRKPIKKAIGWVFNKAKKAARKLGRMLGFGKEEENMILGHEKAHVRQGHSWDVLAVEVFRIILWFNPIAHLN